MSAAESAMMDATRGYVHGYHESEDQRLIDQAGSLVELLHHDTRYADGAYVLEAGCGVGAQTVTLATNSPTARFLAVDISAASLDAARRRVADARLTNVEMRQADLLTEPFPAGSFDHVFVCFVLEHLAQPEVALAALRRMLRPGGTITVIEGDHGITTFHPDSAAAHDAIDALVELQARAGGDATIGRRVYPLLVGAGFTGVHVSPRMVYVDDGRPALVEGFTRNTFTAMIAGVRAEVVASGLLSEARFDQGIRDLERTAAGGGVFCYTFFKGIGEAPAT